MDQLIAAELPREPWNKGKFVGQKAPHLAAATSGRTLTDVALSLEKRPPTASGNHKNL
jgi:hypothetical protein